MNAEIIAVGSELLSPFRQDTNSLYLTGELNSLGVDVAFKTIVGDTLTHLTEAARVALSRVDIVVFSGGLGPTVDDLTREAVAAALERPLVRSDEIIEAIKKRAAARKMKLTENNLRQADVIEGAEVLINPNGTAPGQYIDTVFGQHRKLLLLLPGPPREQQPLFRDLCIPKLRTVLPKRFFARRVLRIALTPESHVDARVSPIYREYTDVETSILFKPAGEIQLHFLCGKKTQGEAQARVDELASRCEAELDDVIFSSQGESLEEVVLLMLGMRNLTLATAESCTGGLLGERLTAIPGSSRSYLGGAIVYSDDLKTRFANVPRNLIRSHGAVSKEVAVSLAEGIRTTVGADLGIGITGIAGPGGATLNKPVGRVYIAFAGEGGSEVKELDLAGDRERVRLHSTQHALDMLRRKLMERS